jgi:hypothetical protein
MDCFASLAMTGGASVAVAPVAQSKKVFLVLFLQKKNGLPCLH